MTAIVPTTDLFNVLKELQSLRKAAIRMQIKMNNGCQALVARFIGYQPNMTKKERDEVWDKAGKIVHRVERNKPIDENFDCVISFIKQNQNARSGYDAYRDDIQEQMVELVSSLPYTEWFASMRGFSELALARILGESGDLKNYSNPGKLWKRFALHVYNGYAPSSYGVSDWVDGYVPSKKEWIEISNVAQRRAEIYSIIQVGVVQCRNPEYRTVFDERKTYEKERNPEIRDGHAHKRAHRYVAKRLLRDLWKKVHNQE